MFHDMFRLLFKRQDIPQILLLAIFSRVFYISCYESINFFLIKLHY